MALEMTDEQTNALANLLLACGSTRGCEAGDAARVWCHVRDIVLAAAKKECEAVMDRFNASAQSMRDKLMRAYEECGANGAANCVAAIHELTK